MTDSGPASQEAMAGDTPMIENITHPLNLQLANSTQSAQLVERSCGCHQRLKGPNTPQYLPERSDESSDAETYPSNLTLKQRVKYVTWAWFSMTMATGGIANALHAGKGYHKFGKCSEKS